MDLDESTVDYETKQKQLRKAQYENESIVINQKQKDHALTNRLAYSIHTSRLEDEYYNKYANADTYQNEYPLRVRADLEKAKEIDREKNKLFNEIKYRQHVRANSPELLELERQLRTAYTTKSLKTQLKEREVQRLQEKLDKKRADDIVEEAVLDYQKADKIQKDKVRDRQQQYKKELQDQIILNYQSKQNKYEEFLQEKKYFDAVIQRIYDEDQREKEMKMAKMKKTQEEIRKFQEAQQIWKDREKKLLEEENERLHAYFCQQLEEEERKMKEKMLQSAQEEAFKDRMILQLYAEQKAKRDRMNLIEDLHIEEMNQKRLDEKAAAMKKKIQLKLEMQQSLLQHAEEKRQRLLWEEEEDKLYKQQGLEKIANDEKLEQLSAEKRRRKMIQLRRDLENEMLERRAKRAEELKQLLFMEEQEKKHEEEKQRLIEEERIRMLKEHAHHLIGYIPKGVLRLEDIQHLGADVVLPKSVGCDLNK